MPPFYSTQNRMLRYYPVRGVTFSFLWGFSRFHGTHREIRDSSRKCHPAGLSNSYQCHATYEEIPGDLSHNGGRPDVFVNTTTGIGIGLTALDDVFRAHAMSSNYVGSFGSNPRPSLWDMPKQPCARSEPPSVELADPHFALAAGDSYTMEWAALPVDRSCSDYWCYVNRLRAFLGNQGSITIDGTGFLPFFPTDTPCTDRRCDIIGGLIILFSCVQRWTNYIVFSCINSSCPAPTAYQRQINETCGYRGESEQFLRAGYADPHWEHWDPERLKSFFDHQGITYAVSSNGNWGGECTCGSLGCLNDVDGAQFVESMPSMMKNYLTQFVEQVHKSGVNRKALVYIETYLSTQASDPETFRDSAVLGKNMVQNWYVECKTPHGQPILPHSAGSKIGDLPLFYGNNSNKYGDMLLRYAQKAFDLGFDGLCEHLTFHHLPSPTSVIFSSYLPTVYCSWINHASYLRERRSR
eukprot:SAG31_NODE_3822_length_3852_cov_2.137490_3_plen_467_part_00